MEIAAALTPEDGLVLGEIGSVLVLLGVASFLASKFKFSSVPIFLGAGLFFGNGGIIELNLSDDFLNLVPKSAQYCYFFYLVLSILLEN